MKILLASPEQYTLTGQPNYCRNLKKGLEELGHEVEMTERPSGDYDIAVINDYFPEALDYITAKKIFNISHSKYEGDKPIIDKRIYKHLAPRTQVSDYWNIEPEILPIPIEFKRWEKDILAHPVYRIIAPCTIDYFRLPMLQDLCSRANKNCQVWLVGRDCGALRELHLNEYVRVFNETQRVEDLMCQCDEVAGIFIGTVALEAWAMGLKTSVYDENGKWEYVEKPQDFNKHSHIEVAKKLLTL